MNANRSYGPQENPPFPIPHMLGSRNERMEKLYGIDTLKGRVPRSHALRDNLTEPQRSGFYEEKRGPLARPSIGCPAVRPQMNKKDSFFDYLQDNWKDVFGKQNPFDEDTPYYRFPVVKETKETVYIAVPDIKEVIIMRGLPGSGKSTFVEENFPSATVCSADNFFLNDDGDYVFVPYKISEAHQDCWGHYIDALFRKEEQIVVDNTNMCSWEYANYVKLATKKGYTVRIICMSAGLHDETSVDTLAKRNSHGVDAEAIARMKDRYEPDVAEELA